MRKFQNNIYDIIICGGGMTGAAMALCMANLKMKVAVIETSQPSKFLKDQPFDLRVSAVSPQTVTLLNSLGAWENILKMRCCPYRELRVWEKDGFGDVTFNANQIDRAELGFIAENRVIQLALWKQIKTKEYIDVYCPNVCERFEYRANAIYVDLNDGTRISGNLLIGADGAKSVVRTAFSIGSSQHKYNQSCLVASVRAETTKKDITWQRFLKTGPQAFLPLSKSHGSIVWYHNPNKINELVQLSNNDLASKIIKEFPRELGKIKVMEKASFPLHKSHASKYVKPKLALVGDAAHTINPLAGQGVNLGFQDVACLTEIIKAAQENGSDWSSQEVLMGYQTRRRFFNSIMMHSMDIFYYGFSNNFGPLKFARNSILSLARLPAISEPIIRYAAGLDVGRSLGFPK